MDFSRDIALVDRTVFKNSSLNIAPDSGYDRSVPSGEVSLVQPVLSNTETSLLSTISGVVPVIGLKVFYS